MSGYDWRTGRYVVDDEAPVESASGTTSPNNAHSGSKLYLIPLFLVLALLVGMTGCTMYAVSMIPSFVSRVSDAYTGTMDELDGLDLNNLNLEDLGIDDLNMEELEQLDSLDDVIDYLQDYRRKHLDSQEPQTAPHSTSENSTTVSVEDVLDYDLSIYTSYVSNGVMATSYAGADAKVQEVVRAIVKQDKNATGEVVRMLHRAARDADGRADVLGEAITFANDTEKALADFDCTAGGAITDSALIEKLEAGRDAAAKRWNQLALELELMTAGDIAYSRLVEIDDELAEATDEAGTQLTSALTSSAAR